MELYDTTLSNGLRVVGAPRPWASDVALCLIVHGAGWMSETDTTLGINHMLEHLTFDGIVEAPNAVAFQSLQHERGIELNAATEDRVLYYHTICHPNDLAGVLELMFAAALRPLLSELDFERQRGIVTDELVAYYDDYENFDTFDALDLARGTPGFVLGQAVDNARLITYRQARAAHRRYFYPANMTLIVSGAASRGDVTRRVAKYAGWRDKPLSNRWRHCAPPHHSTTIIPVTQKQCALTLGFRHDTPRPTRRRRLAYQVLTTLMEFRAYDRLVNELGIAYHATAWSYFMGCAQISGLSSVVMAYNLQRLHEELLDVANTPVTRDEIDAAKRAHIIRMMGLDSQTAMIDFLYDQIVSGETPLDPEQIKIEVESLAPAYLIQLAGRLYDPANMHTLLRAPRSARRPAFAQQAM